MNPNEKLEIIKNNRSKVTPLIKEHILIDLSGNIQKLESIPEKDRSRSENIALKYAIKAFDDLKSVEKEEELLEILLNWVYLGEKEKDPETKYLINQLGSYLIRAQLDGSVYVFYGSIEVPNKNAEVYTINNHLFAKKFCDALNSEGLWKSQVVPRPSFHTDPQFGTFRNRKELEEEINSLENCKALVILVDNVVFREGQLARKDFEQKGRPLIAALNSMGWYQISIGMKSDLLSCKYLDEHEEFNQFNPFFKRMKEMMSKL